MASLGILEEIKTILESPWETRQGRKVPETDDVSLENQGVGLTGTVLYADMADSTDLVDGYKPWFAAEIYKSYLAGACRVIRDRGGVITAFDGDRVMAVFIGTNKNSAAARAALSINYLAREINKLVNQQYPSTAYTLRQSVGIDTSELFVARIGIRNSNDLVWVGRAANYAAKLCAFGDSDYPTVITKEVYSKLSASSKYAGNPRKTMWEKIIWPERGIAVYRSNWFWEF